MDAFDKALAEARTQGSEEWHDDRLGRFTASEFYKLMGGPRSKEDKEAGKLSVAATTYIAIKVSEVLTGQRKSDTFAYAKEYGKVSEPYAIQHFIEETGFTWEPVGFVLFGDHAGCSPDGKINGTDGLEIKCPAESENHLWHLLIKDQKDLKSICPDYYWQIMTGLRFTGWEKWHFASFDPRMQNSKNVMHRIPVYPNKDEFDLIDEKLERAIQEKERLIKLLS
jgi:hypothetical protein